MYEGEINMGDPRDGGQAEVEVDANQIVIRMTDTGPGIPDVEQAMQEGYSTAGQTARELGLRRWHGPAQYEALLRRDDH